MCKEGGEDAGALRSMAGEKIWASCSQRMQLGAPTVFETPVFLGMFGCCPDKGGKEIWDQLTSSRDSTATSNQGWEWVWSDGMDHVYLLPVPLSLPFSCVCTEPSQRGVIPALGLRPPLPRVPRCSVQDPASTWFSRACSFLWSYPETKPNCSLPKGAVKRLAPETLLCKKWTHFCWVCSADSLCIWWW